MKNKIISCLLSVCMAAAFVPSLTVSAQNGAEVRESYEYSENFVPDTENENLLNRSNIMLTTPKYTTGCEFTATAVEDKAAEDGYAMSVSSTIGQYAGTYNLKVKSDREYYTNHGKITVDVSFKFDRMSQIINTIGRMSGYNLSDPSTEVVIPGIYGSPDSTDYAFFYHLTRLPSEYVNSGEYVRLRFIIDKAKGKVKAGYSTDGEIYTYPAEVTRDIPDVINSIDFGFDGKPRSSDEGSEWNNGVSAYASTLFSVDYIRINQEAFDVISQYPYKGMDLNGDTASLYFSGAVNESSVSESVKVECDGTVLSENTDYELAVFDEKRLDIKLLNPINGKDCKITLSDKINSGCNGYYTLTPDSEYSMSFKISDSRQKAEIHISSQGNDNADGSANKPLATLERAIELYKSNLTLGIQSRLIIHEGVYRIKDTIELDSEASGLVIEAYNNDKVKLVGSERVNGLKKVTDEKILSRVRSEARNKIYSADLSGSISDYAIPDWSYDYVYLSAQPELIANDEECTIARWPDDGFKRVGRVLDYDDSHNGTKFGTDSDNLKKWTSSECDIKSVGYFSSTYAAESIDIEDIDIENNAIGFGKQSRHGLCSNGRYYVYNLLEELSANGEYYIDPKTKTLYYCCDGSISDTELEITVNDKNIFNLSSGANNITIKNIDIANTRAGAIYAYNCSGVKIEDCNIYNTGTFGVSFVSCQDCTVENSKVYNTGTLGVSLDGGRQVTLTPGNNSVKNCEMYNNGRIIRNYLPSVKLSGVGNSVTGTYMHDLPHSAITFSGNDHKIYGNYIENAVYESADSGAIYSNLSIVNRGTQIYNNVFKDIEGYIDDVEYRGARAIYADDMLCDLNVYENVFVNCYCPFEMGGGNDLKFNNNIIFVGDYAIDAQQRALGAGTNWYNYYVKDWGTFYTQLTDMRQQIDSIDDENGTLLNKWYTKYPGLKLSYEQVVEAETRETDSNGAELVRYPQRCEIQNNIFVSRRSNLDEYWDIDDGYTADLGEGKNNIIQGNYLTTDLNGIEFKAPEDGDFTLLTDTSELVPNFKGFSVDGNIPENFGKGFDGYFYTAPSYGQRGVSTAYEDFEAYSNDTKVTAISGISLGGDGAIATDGGKKAAFVSGFWKSLTIDISDYDLSNGKLYIGISAKRKDSTSVSLNNKTVSDLIGSSDYTYFEICVDEGSVKAIGEDGAEITVSNKSEKTLTFLLNTIEGELYIDEIYFNQHMNEPQESRVIVDEDFESCAVNSFVNPKDMKVSSTFGRGTGDASIRDYNGNRVLSLNGWYNGNCADSTRMYFEPIEAKKGRIKFYFDLKIETLGAFWDNMFSIYGYNKDTPEIPKRVFWGYSWFGVIETNASGNNYTKYFVDKEKLQEDFVSFMVELDAKNSKYYVYLIEDGERQLVYTRSAEIPDYVDSILFKLYCQENSRDYEYFVDNIKIEQELDFAHSVKYYDDNGKELSDNGEAEAVSAESNFQAGYLSNKWISAVYENGVLKDVKTYQYKHNDKIQLHIPEGSAENDYRVKTFLLDDMSSLVPQCKPFTVGVKPIWNSVYSNTFNGGGCELTDSKSFNIEYTGATRSASLFRQENGVLRVETIPSGAEKPSPSSCVKFAFVHDEIETSGGEVVYEFKIKTAGISASEHTNRFAEIDGVEGSGLYRLSDYYIVPQKWNTSDPRIEKSIIESDEWITHRITVDKDNGTYKHECLDNDGKVLGSTGELQKTISDTASKLIFTIYTNNTVTEGDNTIFYFDDISIKKKN